MKIDLLNTEVFTNAAFDQIHNTYVNLREERKKTLEKVRNQAVEEVKKELLKKVCWWQICDFDGQLLGYGYGDAEAVANQFVGRDYKDGYDTLWVKQIENGKRPKNTCTEKLFKVDLKLGYDYNNPAFKNLEEELKNKGLVLPEIR